MSVLHRDPETMGGEPVFKGSRVLLENLFGVLENGLPLSEFLLDFPGISRETAIAALEEARLALTLQLTTRDENIGRRWCIVEANCAAPRSLPRQGPKKKEM